MLAHRILQEFLKRAKEAGINGDNLLSRLQGRGKITKKEKAFLANLKRNNSVLFDRQLMSYHLKFKPYKLY